MRSTRRKLASAGIADASSLRIYAVGHLVLWVPNNSPFDPQKLQMELLTQPAVTHIAIANPQHAPYGRAAMTALEHYGLKAKVAGKLVFGENVSQAAQFVQSGNAQAGLIALSLAKSPAMESAGQILGAAIRLVSGIEAGRRDYLHIEAQRSSAGVSRLRPVSRGRGYTSKVRSHASGKTNDPAGTRPHASSGDSWSP